MGINRVVKENTVYISAKHVIFKYITFFVFCLVLILLTLSLSAAYFYEKTYVNRIYPGIRIDGVAFGGKTKEDVVEYFQKKNTPLKEVTITLLFEDKIASLSAEELSISYDEKLVSTQAYLIGRSGNHFTDIYQKWKAGLYGISLRSVLQVNNEFIDQTIQQLANHIDYAAQDALFQFVDGKVEEFKPSRMGRRLDEQAAKNSIYSFIENVTKQENYQSSQMIITPLVQEVFPEISTENSNNFGIKELLGVGNSKFVGSIPGRIHNIVLAAKKLHGHLIAPGTTFSFNETLGDVSASTGFQPAYIIKDGRTVLGDGGGVCQVSTTIFRAALNSGLPIVERHPHAYRVSYYEQDLGPGLDATVFAPGFDLKFKNDTSNYILIQTKVDPRKYTLTFEFYGTRDGRNIELTKPMILSQTPPPPDLYQDDPTLISGVVKQVDWKAWGAKVTFDYKVIKNNEIITQQTFFSTYRPWQSVYLRGTL